MDIETLKVNVENDASGIWVDSIPEMGDLRLKVRPNDSSIVRSHYARLLREVPRSNRDHDMRVDVETMAAIDGRVLAEVVLLDWANFSSGGVDLPYSKERATDYLSDPAYRLFRDAVDWASRAAAIAAMEVRQAVLGNSEPPSNGG